MLKAIAARMAGRCIELQVCGQRDGAGLWLRVPSSDVLAFREVYTRGEYAVSFLKDPDFIIDAGANVGLTTSFLANRYPKALIVAVEPENGNFVQLQKNTRDLRNVRCIQAALWAESRSLAVVHGDGTAWGYQTIPETSLRDRQSETLSSIQAITIPEIMNEFGMERICFLKLDIEGAERELFMASEQWIDQVDVISVELHERFRRGTLRSFYNGTNGFAAEWIAGDTVWLARQGILKEPSESLDS